MTTSQTKLMEQCHAEAMDKYPPAWGPSPGGMSIDHNHVPRKAYAQALYDERSKDPSEGLNVDKVPHVHTVYDAVGGGYICSGCEKRFSDNNSPLDLTVDVTKIVQIAANCAKEAWSGYVPSGQIVGSPFGKFRNDFRACLTSILQSKTEIELTEEQLANEIRIIDGNHDLGASSIAEAIISKYRIIPK